MNWVFWAPLGAASLHIVEEFLYPGGFVKWYRCYRPEIQKSITPRFLVIINALLLALCGNVAALQSSPPLGPALWLAVAALLFANGVWHIVGTIKTRSYSPGVITGVSLYGPLAAYGYLRFLGSREVSWTTAIVACAGRPEKL